MTLSRSPEITPKSSSFNPRDTLTGPIATVKRITGAHDEMFRSTEIRHDAAAHTNQLASEINNALRTRYLSGARLIALLVLEAIPAAAYVQLDDYADDDTFDCGPVLAGDGTILLDDATDLCVGSVIEHTLESWSGTLLSALGFEWLEYSPTGNVRINLSTASQINEFSAT